MDRLRVTIDSTVFEAELFDTPAGKRVRAALPFEAEARHDEDGIVADCPVYVATEDQALATLRPGEIGCRTLDQALIVGCDEPDDEYSGGVCLAAHITVFARLTSNAEALGRVAPRCRVRFEAIER